LPDFKSGEISSKTAFKNQKIIGLIENVWNLKGIGHFLEPDLKHEKIDLITERMTDHKKVEKIQESFNDSDSRKATRLGAAFNLDKILKVI
jgi:hypothetical protein